jgi:hypothetical protein
MLWPTPISASSARRSATTCWSPAARASHSACPPPIAGAADRTQVGRRYAAQGRRRVGGAGGLLPAATLGQIANFKGAHLALDTDAICRGEPVGEKALAWAKDKLGNGPILLSASDKPEAVKALQQKYGVEKSSLAIEATMATLAKGLVAAGVGRLSSPAARPRERWSARST